MKHWTELQDLVAAIEAVALPLNADVRSPAYLPDKITGQEREVDVVIRYKIGSVPVLIAIECRLHGRRQDVQWIEQLVSKRDSIGANILIAVSASGFTKAAKALADAKGIQMRTLETITATEIEGWMHPVIEVTSHVEITEAGMRVGENEFNFIFLDDIAAPEYKDQNGKVPLDRPFFKSSSGDERWPIRMFASMVRKTLGVPVRDIVPRDGSRIRKRYLFSRVADLVVPTIWGLIPATEFLVEVEMWADRALILPEVSTYRAADESILSRRASFKFGGSDSAAYVIQDSGPNTAAQHLVQVHDTESGDVHIHTLPTFGIVEPPGIRHND
jgi:hypothetical protein